MTPSRRSAPTQQFYLIRGCESARSPAQQSPVEGLHQGRGVEENALGPLPTLLGSPRLPVGPLGLDAPQWCLPPAVSAGLYGLPRRSGKLKDLSKFDATFFGVHAKQAHTMDPQLRLLLEVAYEAIVDGGGSLGADGPAEVTRAALFSGPLLLKGTRSEKNERSRPRRWPRGAPFVPGWDCQARGSGGVGPWAGLVSQLARGVLGVPWRPSFLTPIRELVLG